MSNTPQEEAAERFGELIRLHGDDFRDNSALCLAADAETRRLGQAVDQARYERDELTASFYNHMATEFTHLFSYVKKSVLASSR